MFAKIFTILAVLAVAFATPNPKPKADPKPYYYQYPAANGYVPYNAAVYTGQNVAYSALPATYPATYSAVPTTYHTYSPAGVVAHGVPNHYVPNAYAASPYVVVA